MKEEILGGRHMKGVTSLVATSHEGQVHTGFYSLALSRPLF